MHLLIPRLLIPGPKTHSLNINDVLETYFAENGNKLIRSRYVLIFSFLFCSALYLNAQQNKEPDTKVISSIQLPQELDRVLRDYENGWRNKDEKLLASLFAHDGFILRPKHLPVKGRANIEEAYKNSGGPLYLRAFSYEMEDSIAYVIGGYRSKPDGADHGKFIVTLKLLPDGIWYITGDMDNANK